MARRPVGRRRACAGLLAWAASPPASGERIEVAVQPLPPPQPGGERAGALAWRGGAVLSSTDRRFGGWSDLAIAPGSGRVAMISDGGWTLDAGLDLDAHGVPRAMAGTLLGRLRGEDGEALAGAQADAEGLAAMPDGGFLVSFERDHRILRYPSGGGLLSGRPRRMDEPPGLAGAPRNGGIEALAAWPDGTVIAFAEELRDMRGDHRGWIHDGGAWRGVTLADEGFAPTGACIAPDGRLLVLQRRLSMLSFSARIVVLERQACLAGGRLEGRELGRWDDPALVDNLEGISALRAPDGTTLVYLLSDDNYRRLLQRTLLLCFALPG